MDLDGETKGLVGGATAEIYGEGGFNRVGTWWESLDCRLMRVAAGDGVMADPMSPFCAHYPGSGEEKSWTRPPSTGWILWDRLCWDGAIRDNIRNRYMA